MTKVLLLGNCGPILLTVARSCWLQHVELHLLVVSRKQRDCQHHFAGVNSVVLFSPDLIGTAQGIEAIAKHIKKVGATALITMGDRNLLWLAEHRQAFEPSCKVLIQSSESLWQILSKCYQLEIATSVGFQILPVYSLITPNDSESVSDSAFPLVLRPGRDGDILPAFKVQIIKSRKQLSNFLQEFHLVQSPIIAQPFMVLPNLVVHGVRSTEGRVLDSRAYIVSRKFEGVALSLEPYQFPAQLEQLCNDFVEQAGITGCYHFDFLFSPEEKMAYFLEINVRMGGTTDKVMQFGYDEPALLLQAYGVISSLSQIAGTKHVRVVNKRALLKHILWVIKGKITELDYPCVSRYRHILYSCRDFLFAKDSVFDWRDIRGSLWFHLRK